jgi:putative ABC transport system ATP-binding protein
MADIILEVRNLTKTYDAGNAVLDKVSFSARRMEFLLIFGKSGCGKTTLLNILGGLDRPSSGDVIVDGESIANWTEEELSRMRLKKIGFVFQDYNLLNDLTVRENIALPLRFSKEKESGRVDHLLERFDILSIADMKANLLSGGEAQRTAIARAMVNNPMIILADEPTGNLDPENRDTVIEMLQIARRDFNTTVVVASHDDTLRRHATSRIRLQGGRAEGEHS